MNKTATIQLRNLTIGYKGKVRPKIVAENICSDIYAGELTCLLGTNGIGKSTLLRTLSAFQPKLSGDIYLAGKKLEKYTDKALSTVISVVLTEKCDIRNMTVRELIGMGRSPYTGFWGKLSRADDEIVDKAIGLVNIHPLASRMLHTLSDGERQKAMIAKALAQETPVIYLDEPTAFLDFPSKVEIMQLLHHLTRETDKTIFLSTHDLELALQIADKIWLMDKVNGITSGTPEDLALEGYLSRFFARKGITFDMESGLFRITNNYRQEIRLTGHGYRYAMVRKALQRNEILANRDIDSAVYIETNRQPDQFILHFPHQEDIIVHTIEELLEKLHELEPFQPLELNLKEVYGYQYMKVRFGRVNIEYYQKLEKYLFDDLNAIFLEGIRNENYVYGCYFAAHKEMGKIDSTFKSLHFENIALPDDYEGMPAEICRNLRNQIDEIEKEIENVQKQMKDFLSVKAKKIRGARYKLEELSNNFDVRKMAACMENEEQEDYYILCGWMSEKDTQAFIEETKDDDRITIIVEEGREKFFGDPPTKLQNPKFFKPFEMFIRMYGLPSHDEMDPTIFVAITYSFIFGVMFGDVGQGLLLLIGGALIYHFKKAPLAGIIATAGVFSTIFGFMFGSIFGFEDIIEPLWIRPIDHMTTLPFLGKLNTVFIVAVAFGMFLIIVAMILHIINAARSKDIESTWFDPNGVAGLIFYIAVVVTIVLFMTGNPLPGGIVMGIMFGVPLLLIFLKEPLTRMIEKRADKMETGPGMYIVQGFFEMFETLLSYFSNTISFIRIGAFAVSHAAIMEVVLQLAGAESGNPNWFGVIFGNLFVCGFEGLIVGIQVLRLEYYEMFSRFYKGSGRAFDPYTKKKTK